MSVTTFLEAINSALDDELADPNTVMFGEDIGVYGGAFKVTHGLQDKYGKDRVVDTPLAEAAVIGAACGAAMRGMRAIAELQFIDFITCAGFDQIVSVAAKSRYRNGVGCPIVIRGPSGGGGRGGPFHSACPEMWFVNTPGIKVVFPSTAYDAKGLLKAAIRDPDPVLYLEHKFLYRRIKDEVPADDYVVEIGKGAERRAGTDAVIISYGAMVPKALEAAEAVAQSLGKQVRVVDLRSLVPLDEELIVEAARQCGKVLIVHETPRRGGIAGEIAALINEQAFEFLDGPILRVTAPDTPVPYAPTLEDAYLPQVRQIQSALEELLDY